MTALSETKRYQAYPEYKDSGVEWLGEIPSHWKTCRLKHLASIKNGQDYKAVQSEVGYPVMGSGGQFAFATEFMYDKPSVLLGRKGTIDKPLYINEPFWTVDTMYYTEMQPETDAKYLYYLATTIQFARYSTNTALPSMTQEHLGNYIFAVPVEVSDRTQIANFLDHETAKIDTLIEKQQQLIKLLKEKRQAVISHAVTKGLNPQAPMKDSGVEWLGEVPEHWVVSKFAFLKKVLTDYTANGSFADLKANVQYLDEPSFARLVRLTDLRKDLQNDNGVWVDEKSYKYLKKSALFGGEFLLANVGAYAGLFYQMPFEKGPASLAPNMFMAKFDDSKVSREFMAYVGQSSPVASQLRLSATASSAQPKLNKDDFKSVSFCYPTLREQNEIVEHLNQEVRKIEQLLTKQERAIALMQERRTALISAAVTGKIDVRNWQAPTPEYQAMEQTA
ncbi:restriction endonuclease subunit S [Vibrio alginolyticus]|uniref:restriction endonuclease subunit S n=1 Tax=Vibrio alginolyticus TaxID=663 RepID=UPI003552A82B